LALHITELKIEMFRGIREMKVNDLGDINIFVGDNNSGKTSVLEAIQILSDPCAYNLLLTSAERERYGGAFFPHGLSRLDSFMYLFHNYAGAAKSERYFMRLGADAYNRKGSVEIAGSLAMQLIDWNEVAKDDTLMGYSDNGSAAKEMAALTFAGSLCSNLLDERAEALEINEYTPSLIRHTEKPLFPLEYIRPMGHTFRKIINHRDARERAVQLLREFEPNITDLRYIDNNAQRAVPVVETRQGDIPLSVYGDGMKKALVILDAILMAEVGVVLADEFETAIHTSVMGSIFAFFLRSAKEMDVQLFLTTHSLEAVDKLLENAGSDLDRIRLIRLKNKGGEIYAKVIPGTEAYALRGQFEMELRV
jgi:AAA15 family ATPase/GTPase